MSFFGKIRSGLASIRPWLGKTQQFKEVVHELLGKGAKYFSTMPFIGTMAKKAADDLGDIVDSVATPLTLMSRDADMKLSLADDALNMFQDGEKAVDRGLKEIKNIQDAMMANRPATVNFATKSERARIMAGIPRNEGGVVSGAIGKVLKQDPSKVKTSSSPISDNMSNNEVAKRFERRRPVPKGGPSM